MDYYTVQQCDSKGNVLVNYPIVFETHNSASNLVNTLQTQNLTYQILKNRTNVVFNTDNSSSHATPQVVEDYNDEENLEGFHLRSYGKGYILSVDSFNEMYEEPYFYGKDFDSGWWDSRQKGWFFKEKYLDLLLERGAQFNKSVSKNTVKNTHETTLGDDFKGCRWKSYGKGWVLIPKKSHHKYGESYLFGKNYANGGWWNKNAGGWFFKECEYNNLALN